MQMRWKDAASLRKYAEAALVERTRPPDQGISRDALVSELLVHQTELEMQNQSLVEAQAELAAAEEQFRDLFENAPVGYIILEADGRTKIRFVVVRC